MVTGIQPEPGGPEVWGVVSIALVSIPLQVRYISKAEEGRIRRELYRTDEDLIALKEKASKAKKTVTKGFGDTLVVTCPACSVKSPNRVITRKEGAKGIEVLVNCRWKNEWEEVCNNHHTVIEVKAGTAYHN